MPPNVRSLSTQRWAGTSEAPYASLNLGDHVGDAPRAVLKNRRSLRAAAGLPAEPSWLAQQHGTHVVELEALGIALAGVAQDGGAAQDADATPGANATPCANAVPCADASVTGQPGIVCAILTADCLPLLLAAESGDRVGAVHAGWRGLAGGIIEATVAAMRSRPAGLLAWLGPAIGPRWFEIGAEVRDALLADDPAAEAAFQINERGRFTADLFVLARRRLTRAGVERIYGGGECTYSQPDRYFSHRRDGLTGRQATLIWLEQR